MRAAFAALVASLALLGCDRRSSDAAPSESVTPVSTASQAPPDKIDDLNAVLEPLRKKSSLPALAAAVFRGPHLIAQGAVGVRKLGDPTPVTLNDRWHLGSNTKAMTATLIATFAEEDKLSWTAKLPAMLSGVAVDDGYKDVDLDMLLSHRAGVPANFPEDLRTKLWSAGDPRDQRKDAVAGLLARKPSSPPGAVSYSNAGYVVAAAAMERVAGTSWERAIRTRLFDRLGMATCNFGAPGSAGKVDQPWGHDTRGGTPTPVEPSPRADNPAPEGPAGRVHCSLVDYGRFLSMHLAGARGESTMLKPATMKTLQTPRASEQALGWIVAQRPWAGGTALTHSGSNTLFFVTAWIAPAKNLAMVVATNIGDDSAKKSVDDAFAPLIERYAK